MSAARDWGADELDRRRAEDARFPVEPERGSAEWFAYAAMKGRRAHRRKLVGYSRATANGLVRWAQQEEASR